MRCGFSEVTLPGFFHGFFCIGKIGDGKNRGWLCACFFLDDDSLYFRYEMSIHVILMFCLFIQKIL